ncbi:MAG: RNA polymerase sigma factor [Pseudonocardia sp.]
MSEQPNAARGHPTARDPGSGCGGRARDVAFARWVQPEVAVLYRVALTLAGQPADAEDLVQDTLLRAYRAVDRFDGAHPRAWLLTILRNTHRNRARLRLPLLLSQDQHAASVLDTAGAGPSAEDLVVDGMFEAVVARALAALPTIHRVVVQLVDVDGLSYADAAQALGVPRGTVMSRLHRARARIRHSLLEAGLIPPRSRP